METLGLVLILVQPHYKDHYLSIIPHWQLLFKDLSIISLQSLNSNSQRESTKHLS